MVSKEEAVTFINDKVREEHGMPMRTDGSKLVETGIDSFGTVMILLELENEYGVYSKEELKTVAVEELTLGDMVNRILNEGNK
jgi:acyl carrier protein